MNFDHSPALRMVNSTCLQQHLIEFTFCHNDWSLLVTFLNFNFTFFLLADFDPLYLFVNRLLKYSNAVDLEELILELIGVLSFGVGKFLILGYNGFGVYLLTFHRRCQVTAQL